MHFVTVIMFDAVNILLLLFCSRYISQLLS